MKLSKKLTQLPSKPGLYFFKNSRGQTIYIGKSVNLKNRVKSYFQNRALGPWTKKMVSEIKNIKIKVLVSEFEALLLEAKLINQYQPFYNIRSKDDKRFLMIAISHEDFPRIYLTRTKEDPKALYFGPYPSSNEVRQVLRILRPIFPYRTCRLFSHKPCFYYYLGLCPACEPNANKKEYQKTVKKIIKFLSGNIKGLVRELNKEMKQEAKKLHFEKAKELKKQIEAITYVVSNWQNLTEKGLSLNLNKDNELKILNEAKKIFPKLRALKRIEAYDISNLYGQEATGSLVVFENLIPNKNEYRRFRMRSKATPDDAGMIYEVLTRRLDHQEWEMPNLIVVDGGKGQVSAVFAGIREKKLIKKVNLLGLAKQEELIIVPQVYQKNIINFKEIKLNKDNSFLRLLQHVRDESHRFARKYHLLLRKKKLL